METTIGKLQAIRYLAMDIAGSTSSYSMSWAELARMLYVSGCCLQRQDPLALSPRLNPQRRTCKILSPTTNQKVEATKQERYKKFAAGLR